MEEIVVKYLENLKIPIARNYCKKLIASHPDYPSLLSIADTLERLGIHYKATRVNKKQLDQLSFPYLVFSDKRCGEKLVLIKNKNDLNDINQKGADDMLAPKDQNFREQAVVLQIAKTDTIADLENDRQRSKEAFLQITSVVFGLSLAGLPLLYLFFWNLSWVFVSLLITACIGGAIGYLLIAKELGVIYQSVESFCRAGTKTDCNKVLDSKAAILFDPVTLSDITASYFLFQIIMLVLVIPLSGDVGSYYEILGLLSMLSIPVVGFYLYYQAFVVKILCRLCLIVDGILIGQAGLFLYMITENIILVGNLGLFPVTLTVLLLTATCSGVLLIKSILKRTKESERAEVAGNRVKYTPAIFTHLLHRQEHVNTMTFKQEMLIGEPDAPLVITMAASLGCDPCKKAFERAAQLVTVYPGKASLAIRLRSSGRKINGIPDASTYLIEYWLEHIHGQTEESARTEQLIRDWYNKIDIELFMKKYSFEKKDYMQNGTTDLASRHNQWFEQTGIQATPTFLINGWWLPRTYQIEDLMTLTPLLTDYITNDNKEIVSDATYSG